MSISCPHCGAVAGYGHELGHKSDCPALSGPLRIKTLRFSNDWLRQKIANDPDVEVDAGVGHPEAPTRSGNRD